ncbi:MAG: tetratricopeptide repeat protein [Gemmatimonadota bacterium]
MLAALPLAAAIVWGGGCGYVNTFYNAERAFEEGVRLSAASRDSLPAAARGSFERAAEKSGIVLARYAGSRYADDALLLLGKSLARLGRHDDAAAAFRRFLDRFPEADGVAEARLELARSERLRGDRQAARLALTPLLQSEEGGGGLAAEVLYERAMLDLATGQHAPAVEGFREILERHPEFAGEHRVALEFAEAELAAEDYAAALDAYAAYRESSPDAGARQEVALRVARALVLAERPTEALTTYDAILSDRLADTLAARVHEERAEILAAEGRTAEAEEAYRRVAELAPGTPLAAMATLKLGRIVWREGGRREEALEILLDAFLHAPTTAFADSARAEARELAQVIHFEQLAAGDHVVAEIDDPDLARSTALYRLAEEVLDSESDPATAADLFRRLVERYPESPWRPRALLAVGMLERATGNVGEGETALRSVIELYPDTPESDSARRLLGDSLPTRPADFYTPSPVLVSLAAALPEAEDPMVRITDQLDRYAAAREEREREDLRSAAGRDREGGQLRPPSEREPGRPGSATEPGGEGPPGRVPLEAEP